MKWNEIKIVSIFQGYISVFETTLQKFSPYKNISMDISINIFYYRLQSIHEFFYIHKDLIKKILFNFQIIIWI